MRAAWLVPVIASVLVSEARPADACSCGSAPTIPARDATGVPTNLREVAAPWHPFEPFELIGPSGPVALGEPRTEGRRSYGFVPILSALEPNTPYELRYDSFQTLTFTTGDGPDLEAPGPVAVSGLAIARGTYAPNIVSSCGTVITRVRGGLTAPADAPLLGVRITGGDLVLERTVPGTSLSSLGTEACVPVQIDGLVPDAAYEIEIWALDLAGNAGPSHRETVVVRDCPCITPYAATDLFSCASDASCPAPTDPPTDDGGCSAAHPALLAGLAALLVPRRRRR